MVILIDNGHGFDTPGKRSPDGTFYEWAFAREISLAVKTRLHNMRFDARLLVPEQSDISLQERVRRANAIYKNDKDTFLVSIHANAAGDGSKWMTGTGWECFTSPGKTKSDSLAQCFYDQAKLYFAGKKIREDASDGDSDKEASFYILTKTNCPAVLTENFFYDNKDDLKYMTSSEGKNAIAEMHVRAIIDYIHKFAE